MKLNGFLYWFTIGCHLVVLISFIRCVLSALSSLSSFLSSFLSWCVCSIHPFTWFRLHGKIQSYVCPGKLVHTHTQTHWHRHLFVILAPNSTSTLSLWLLRARVYVCVNSNTLLFIILALLLRNIVTYHCRLHNTCRECVCKRFFSPACSFIHSPMFFCSLSFLPTAS